MRDTALPPTNARASLLFDTMADPSSNDIIIYTDGACSGNPGPGGWGALLFLPTGKQTLSGGARKTTNNRMEMTAALEALRALEAPSSVRLHTDSAYLVNAFKQNWMRNWKRNGWKNSSKKPVANKDLWQALLEMTARHDVEWVKVKGHADDELNNEVDRLAVSACQQYIV